MKAKLGLICLLACVCTAHAKTPKFFGVPTQYTSPSGYVFGVSGVYQYDLNDFSDGGIDPATGQPLFEDANTWKRRELDAYLKAPNGFEVDVGYDWSNTWADNYLKYSSKKLGDFRLGQFLTPVGWQQLEGAPTWTFLTPSLPDLAVAEGRRIGADWTYGGLSQWLFKLQYFWGGNLDGDHAGRTWAARVVFHPIKRKREVLHLGLAASREYPDDHLAHFAAAPEASLTKTHLVDTRPLPFTDSIDRAGLELGFLHGSFFAQGEYLTLAAHRDHGLPEFRGHGYYVLGSWMLTGETARTYKDGAFSLPAPDHRYGAFEVALRYSELDLRDGLVRGGHEENWTVGLNWYFRNLELQANYVWAHANGSPVNHYVAPLDPRVFEVRAQISFGP